MSLPDARKLQVAANSEGLCEYCLIHEKDTALGCQVDHIISKKHGGSDDLSNLAYACCFCNRKKGSDIGSIDWVTRNRIEFYNPRIEHWGIHFELNVDVIVGKTPIGEVTARILGFNLPERLIERAALVRTGLYPRRAARSRMGPYPSYR
jgi:hypothetical protein